MSLIKKLAGQTLLYGLSSILSRLLNYFVLTVYLTRVFTGVDVGQYGIYGIMYAFSALLMVFFTYRMETTFFRYGGKDGKIEETFSTASISLLISTFILVTLTCLFSESIATQLLDQPGKGRYVIYFALIMGIDTLSVLPFARLRLENKPLQFASLKILNILVNIGVLIFFLEGCAWFVANGYADLFAFYDPKWNLDYVFIANLAASFVTLIFFFPQYFRTHWVFDRELWSTMLRYAGPLIIVGIAGVASMSLDRILLSEFLPGEASEKHDQIGIYNACVKLAVLMNLFIQAFNYAAEPFFFNNANRADSKHVYGQVAQAFSLVGSLVFLGLMLYLDWVKYIIGADYREGLVVVPIMLIAYLFLGLYYNFSIWYKLSDRTDIGAYISVAGAFIAIGLNVLLIPKIGYMGSAWAALATYVFMAVANYFASRKYYPIDYPVGKMGSYLFFAIVAYFLSDYLRPSFEPESLKLFLVNTAILLAYLGAIAFIERSLLRDQFKQITENRNA